MFPNSNASFRIESSASLYECVLMNLRLAVAAGEGRDPRLRFRGVTSSLSEACEK